MILAEARVITATGYDGYKNVERDQGRAQKSQVAEVIMHRAARVSPYINAYAQAAHQKCLFRKRNIITREQLENTKTATK